MWKGEKNGTRLGGVLGWEFLNEVILILVQYAVSGTILNEVILVGYSWRSGPLRIEL